MAHRTLNPATLPKPASRYAQAVQVADAGRWLHVSGQVGVAAEGRLAPDAAGQHRQVWQNLLAALAAAEMGPEHLVKITAYVTAAEQVALYREARDRALGGREVASTLVIVSGLVHPDFVVEVEAVAAA